MIETSIIIPTYNRPQLLARAVSSCVAQQGVESGYEILVVDNNPDGSARPGVEGMARDSAIPIRYVWEPRPGISQARNAGVAAASGRYIAFLDDDEEADPRWLAAHLRAIREFAADIVIGAVHAVMPRGAIADAPYPRCIFSRDLGLPNGAVLHRLPGIGNTLLKRDTCFVDPEPFEPSLGLTGGEDTLFLRQALRRGCKMVWCPEASVREAVPEERLSPRYLLRRAFRGGQITTYACAAVRPPQPLQIVRMMLAGAVQLLLFGIPALFLRSINHARWLPLMDRAVLGLGKLLWHPNWQPRSYR